MSITRYTMRTRRDKYGWFAEAIEAQYGSYVLYDDHAAEVARLTAENERLRSENDLVRGAMAADDERLRLAAERVGIIAGCDAPEEMADMIEHLRSTLRSAESRIGLLARFAVDDARESCDDLAQTALSQAGLIEWRVKQAAFSYLDDQAPDWWHDLDVGDRYWVVTDECQRLMDAVAAAKGGSDATP